ncbi:MAG TPA: 6,7-dimethyl-8-ribityllumazine synthase [Nitrospiria bacterium]
MKGNLRGGRLRIGIVLGKFNRAVTDELLAGAMAGLKNSGVRETDIGTFRVPGAFEIPLTARRLAGSGLFDAIICLGAVIRGDTPHFEYICSAVSQGIMEAMLGTGVPIIFGVLTTDTVHQARERADAGGIDRGGDAAKTAVEMVHLLRGIK